MPTRSRHPVVIGMALILALVTLVGCGSDDGPASTTAGGATTADTKATEVLAARLGKARQIPAFREPGPAFNAKKAAGKTVFNISVSTANAFIAQVDAGAREAAQRAGVTWIQYENQGSPAEWSRGMQLAITQGVDLITLTAVDPARVVTQIKAAEKAGIPVVNVHAVVEGQEPAAAPVTAYTYGPFLEAAQLEADWVIADSKGKAEVLLITTNEFPPSKPQRDVMQREFRQHCPDCKVTVVDVPPNDWPTKLSPAVQSFVLAHPNARYVVPFYDSEAPFVRGGVRAAGKADKIKIVTYNGTPSVLKLIQAGDVVAMDVGENPKAIGYLGMDQVLRVLSGVKPAKHSTNAVRVFEASNVAEAGKPPKLGVGYGSEEEPGLLKLWGLDG